MEKIRNPLDCRGLDTFIYISQTDNPPSKRNASRKPNGNIMHCIASNILLRGALRKHKTLAQLVPNLSTVKTIPDCPETEPVNSFTLATLGSTGNKKKTDRRHPGLAKGELDSALHNGPLSPKLTYQYMRLLDSNLSFPKSDLAPTEIFHIVAPSHASTSNDNPV